MKYFTSEMLLDDRYVLKEFVDQVVYNSCWDKMGEAFYSIMNKIEEGDEVFIEDIEELIETMETTAKVTSKNCGYVSRDSKYVIDITTNGQTTRIGRDQRMNPEFWEYMTKEEAEKKASALAEHFPDAKVIVKEMR